MIPVGRLDLATSGLLILTNDTQFANWLTDPDSRRRSRLPGDRRRPRDAGHRRSSSSNGVTVDGETTVGRGRSRFARPRHRESHLTITLREGKNREVRRLLAPSVIPSRDCGGCSSAGSSSARWRRESGGASRAKNCAPPSLPTPEGARRCRNKAAASPHRRPRARPDRPRCPDPPWRRATPPGIATPSRHAKIIDSMIARKIAAATVDLAAPREHDQADHGGATQRRAASRS